MRYDASREQCTMPEIHDGHHWAKSTTTPANTRSHRWLYCAGRDEPASPLPDDLQALARIGRMTVDAYGADVNHWWRTLPITVVGLVEHYRAERGMTTRDNTNGG